MILTSCTACARHARVDEPSCPFCGGALAPPPRVRRRGRISSRAALVAGATFLAAACGGGEAEPSEPDDQAETSGDEQPADPAPEDEGDPPADETADDPQADGEDEDPPPDLVRTLYGGPPVDDFLV